MAQFYRGRVAPQLTEFQPVEFSQFQQEYVMMQAGLAFVSEQNCEHHICFSERMWKNILAGKSPCGGKTIINRDPTEWPSMDEICTLTGVKRNNRTDGFDYLCIKAPRQIAIGPQQHQVTSSFTMLFQPANEMVRQLRYEFIRILLWWITEEMMACNRRGIQRDVITCIDHFYYHYNVCLGTNKTDRDSMRRMAIRWLEEAKMLPTNIDEKDAYFISEVEENDTKTDIDTLIKSVKLSANKS